MKSLYSKSLLALSLGFFICGCSNGTTNNNGTPAVTVTSTMNIDQTINFGIGKSNQIMIEFDGSFIGTGDQIKPICAANANPSFSILSDNKDQIIIEMAPLDDACSFQVQNGSQFSNNSEALTLSHSQGALEINFAYDRGFIGGSSNDDLVIYGKFTGSDKVWSSCDGATVFTRAAIISIDDSNEIDFEILSPGQFNSCQFFVEANGVQSQVFNVMAIDQVSDLGASGPHTDLIQLKGLFVGDGNDVVYSSCDGASNFTAQSSLLSDSISQIELSIPSPNNFSSCQFIVANNQVQSNTYSILSIQNAFELGLHSGNPNLADFVVEGVFAGYSDQVWAACDGDSFAQYALTLDSNAQLRFAIPTPIDVQSCQLFVQNGNYQTTIYSFGKSPAKLPVRNLRSHTPQSI